MEMKFVSTEAVSASIGTCAYEYACLCGHHVVVTFCCGASPEELLRCDNCGLWVIARVPDGLHRDPLPALSYGTIKSMAGEKEEFEEKADERE